MKYGSTWVWKDNALQKKNSLWNQGNTKHSKAFENIFTYDALEDVLHQTERQTRRLMPKILKTSYSRGKSKKWNAWKNFNQNAYECI